MPTVVLRGKVADASASEVPAAMSRTGAASAWTPQQTATCAERAASCISWKRLSLKGLLELS